MQKTPNIPVFDAPIPLRADFPGAVGGDAVQRDAAITWLHRHDYPEIGLCRDGAGVFAIGERLLPFRGGDVVYIAAGEAHLARSVPGSSSHWVWCYLDFGRLLPEPARRELASASGVLTRPALYREVEKLIEFANAVSPAAALKLHGQALVAAAELAEAARLPSPGARHSDPLALERVRRAINLMSAHYAEAVAIPDLARRCHLSLTHFRRLFVAATGVTPQHYLTRLRVAMAQAELEKSARPIGEIALRSGFATLSSFNRHFLSLTGLTPGRWRRKFNKPPR